MSELCRRCICRPRNVLAEERSIVGVGLEANEAPFSANELRCEHRVPANIGTDVQYEIPWATESPKDFRFKRFPDAVPCEVSRHILISFAMDLEFKRRYMW